MQVLFFFFCFREEEEEEGLGFLLFSLSLQPVCPEFLISIFKNNKNMFLKKAERRSESHLKGRRTASGGRG